MCSCGAWPDSMTTVLIPHVTVLVAWFFFLLLPKGCSVVTLGAVGSPTPPSINLDYAWIVSAEALRHGGKSAMAIGWVKGTRAIFKIVESPSHPPNCMVQCAGLRHGRLPSAIARAPAWHTGDTCSCGRVPPTGVHLQLPCSRQLRDRWVNQL